MRNMRAVAGSSVAAAWGRGVAAAAVAVADNSGNNASRLSRVRAFWRPRLHPLDARRSCSMHEATNQGSMREKSAPSRAAVGDGEGEDSIMMPSSSSSSPSPSTQRQQDLALLRRAQISDSGTTYPLEETRVSERDTNRVEIDWLDRVTFLLLISTSTSTSSSTTNKKTPSTAPRRHGNALGHRRPRLRPRFRTEAPGVHGVREEKTISEKRERRERERERERETERERERERKGAFFFSFFSSLSASRLLHFSPPLSFLDPIIKPKPNNDSYLLPMPVVVAGGRWGASATWQTAAATSLLVLGALFIFSFNFYLFFFLPFSLVFAVAAGP